MMDIDKSIFFFDFDNTITKLDVLDDMLERFSCDDKWRKLEDEWKSGDIGSRECLEGQMKGIRITKRQLDRYLKTIRIDPYFKRLLGLFKANKVRAIILSDNFDYILNAILKNNNIDGLNVHCNSIKISDDVLTPRFPHSDKRCGGCAHCKSKSMLSEVDRGFTSVYIGDGLSDLCPSRKAGFVFAKSALKERLESEGITHVPFDGLKDVYKYVKRRML